MKILISIILLVFISGCWPGLKKTEDSAATSGITTNIFRFWPGYRTRRIKYLEFKVEESELVKRREELRFDMKKIRIKYDKAK